MCIQYIQGKNRTQSILFPESLDQIIDQENEVRIIDLFVESINPSDFKFVIKTSIEGRPAYHPKDLLKLFVYGYLNQIRSSRALEKECKRNIELMWLMKELAPDWHFKIPKLCLHQSILTTLNTLTVLSELTRIVYTPFASSFPRCIS